MSWIITGTQKNNWTPADIDTALWLDAADASTVFTTDTGSIPATNNSAVGRWNDKSGNSRNVIQSNSSQRPIYASNVLNNKSVISFNNVGDYLFRLNATRFAVTGLTAFAVYQKLNCANQCSGNRIVDFSGTTNAAESDKVGFSQGILIFNSSSTATGWLIAGTNRSDVILAGAYVGINGTLGHNNISPFIATGFVSSEQLDFNPVSYQAEIIIYPTFYSASSNIFLKTEGYLAHKWGLTANLPADHPYKTAVPVP